MENLKPCAKCLTAPRERSSYCLPCIRAMYRIWYAGNRKKRSESHARYRDKHRNYLNEKHCEWQKANKEHLSAYHRAWYQKNKARLKAERDAKALVASLPSL